MGARTETYPIAHTDFRFIRRLRATGEQARPSETTTSLHAIETSESRPPKQGEWFLSGASPAAYYAINDLAHIYPIARLVRVRRVTTWEIV